jgi:hypothetical protein
MGDAPSPKAYVSNKLFPYKDASLSHGPLDLVALSELALLEDLDGVELAAALLLYQEDLTKAALADHRQHLEVILTY